MNGIVKAIESEKLDAFRRLEIGTVTFTIQKEEASAEIADVPDVLQIVVEFPDAESEQLRFSYGGYVNIDSMAWAMTKRKQPFAGVFWMATYPEKLFFFAASSAGVSA